MKMFKLKYLTLPIAILAMLMLSACSSSDTGGTTGPGPVLSLNQAGFNPSSSAYEFGFTSIPNIELAGAPADTDYSRWAMLYDGTDYRLYFFKEGSNTQLYQFGFNPGIIKYEYGYNSINVVTINGAPADADPSSIAMLHDGVRYRLYMRGIANPMRLYQFAWDGAKYEYGFDSIDQINITGAPANADFSGWAMSHDGADYRLYSFNPSAPDTMYQYAYNGATYAYGFNSINVLPVTGMPAGSDKTDFAMLHDGVTYRFYYRQR